MCVSQFILSHIYAYIPKTQSENKKQRSCCETSWKKTSLLMYSKRTITQQNVLHRLSIYIQRTVRAKSLTQTILYDAPLSTFLIKRLVQFFVIFCNSGAFECIRRSSSNQEPTDQCSINPLSKKDW